MTVERAYLLLTADAAMAEAFPVEAERREWTGKVMEEMPQDPSASPGSAPLLLVDLRPLTRNGGLHRFAAKLAGVADAARCIHHGIGFGTYDDISGRHSSLPIGLTRYHRVSPEGTTPDSEQMTGLLDRMEELRSSPPYELVDFHEHIPGAGFHHDIVESLATPLIVLDSDDRLALMNLTALAHFDYTAGEVYQQPWEMLVDPASRGDLDDFLFRVRHTLLAHAELDLVDRVGATVPTLVTGSRIFTPDNDPQYLALQIHNVSRKRYLESQVLELQKAESIARLAGGIAHDFNNILGTVLGFASLARDGLGDDHPVANDVDQVISAAERAARLTAKLLDLSRGGKYLVETFDLSDVVRESAELSKTSLERSTNLSFDLHSARIRGDRRQWAQVITNLLLNAGDACSGGETISVESREVRAAELGLEFFRNHPGLDPGLLVRLRVEDSGRGMSAAVRRHAFEPFYTTSGERRGLGLSVVEGIVSNHQGVVELDSRPGVGTEVNIYVPAAEDAVEEHRRRVLDQTRAASGRTVLIVDDEALLREIADRFLRRLGYQTILAAGGEEAIRIIDEDHTRIDVVFLDLLMPGINGRQVAEYLLERHPELPILLVSGYVEQDLVGDLLSAGARGFLAKPYDMETLARRLEETATPPSAATEQ